MPTPAATAVLMALAGARSGARDLTLSPTDLDDIRVGLARGAAGPGVVGSLAGSMMGPAGSMMGPAGYGSASSCGGGSASPFSGYAPAGLLTITNGPGGGAQIVSQRLSVTGASLPAGSILVLDLNQNGDNVVSVASDDQPQGIGAGGVGFSIMDLDNQNAPGLYLAIPATRDVSVTVRFLAASVAGDRVRIQFLSPGGRSVQAQACAI